MRNARISPLLSTLLIFLCALTLQYGLLSPAAAQAFPSKPIRFILGFSPGGPTDLVARLVTQKLTENLGVSAIVDHRPGANSIIGTGLAARSAPDGYTLVMISPSATIHPSVYSNLPYNIVDDFTPVTVLAESSYVIVANPSLPVQSLKDLIELGRSKPGELNYGGAGIGDSLHLAGELLQSMAGFKMQIVTYHGGGPAMTALLGGHVQLMISPIAIALPHLRGGKLRALAVTASKRTAVLPDVPTVAEAGVPGYAVTGWYGLLVPAATPRPIVERLNAEIVKALRHPDTRDRLHAAGMEPVGNSPAEAAAFLKADVAKWAVTAKNAKIPQKAL